MDLSLTPTESIMSKLRFNPLRKKTSSNIEIIHWLIEIFNLLKLFKVLLFPQRKTVENVKWIVYKNRLDTIFVRVCVCGCCSVAVQSSRSTIHVNGMLFLE